MVAEFFTGFLDKIPIFISGIRDFIISIITTLNLPEQPTYVLVAGVIALFLAFIWMKKWLVVSVFARLSYVLNWILLALLIYVTLVYI